MKIFLLLLLFIEFIEPSLEIKVPGLPYYVGKLAFILYGILGLLTYGFDKISRLLIFPFVIWLGFFIGAFLNGPFKTEIASLPYYLSLAVLAYELRDPKFRKNIHRAMMVLFTHSILYILYKVFQNFEYNSYSLFDLTDSNMQHPHNVGIKLTISSIYLIIVSSINNKKILSYLIVGITVIGIIFLESRHNLIAFSGTLIVFLLHLDFKKLFKFIPIPIIVVFILIKLSPAFERTEKRFNFRNVEYQSRTTEARFQVLRQFPKQFSKRFLGKGTKNIRADYGLDNEMTPHNQYISVAFAGGIISICAMLFLIFSVSKKTFLNMKSKYFNYYELPFLFILINIGLTLFFIEFWGVVWFLFLTFLVYFKSIKVKLLV